MSGFEVAGLVLGALPVLIEAVTVYKSGIQTSKIFFRKKAIVNKLTSALLLQRETLAQIVKSILEQSGCGDALDLEKNPYECLSKSQTQFQILEFLGHDNLFIINETLKQSYDTVKRVARNIGGLVPSAEGATDNLRQIIHLNLHEDRGWLDLVPRIKLMFSASEISKAIKDLDDIANSLLRLTSLIASNRQPVEQQQSSSRKALKLGKALRQVRRYAVDLHQAIFQAWRPGCHSSHEAKLFLEDRIETMGEASKDIDMGFQLIFVAASPRSNSIMWHKATVKVCRDLVDEDSTDAGPPPYQKSKVTLVLPKDASQKPQLPLVKDMCEEMVSAGRCQRRVALVLSKNQQMGTIWSDKDAVAPCQCAEKVTLKALLGNSNHGWRPSIPLKPRMILALGLASSLLQLSRTPWLQTPWRKEEIYFLRTPGPTSGSYDFSRPFISLAFNTNDATTPQPQPIDPKVAFLELGILLLEIWNTETLETHFPDQQNPVEYYQRLALAMKWLDDMDNPPPDLYDKAVSHCIRGMMGGEVRFPDWEDTKFWGAVCQDVIDPLHEICKQWKSLPR